MASLPDVYQFLKYMHRLGCSHSADDYNPYYNMASSFDSGLSSGIVLDSVIQYDRRGAARFAHNSRILNPQFASRDMNPRFEKEFTDFIEFPPIQFKRLKELKDELNHNNIKAWFGTTDGDEEFLDVLNFSGLTIDGTTISAPFLPMHKQDPCMCGIYTETTYLSYHNNNSFYLSSVPLDKIGVSRGVRVKP